MAVMLGGEGVLDTDPGLIEHVQSAYATLVHWLTANAYNVMWPCHVEYSLAYSPKLELGRQCEPPNEAHVYPDLRADEVGGTADLIVEPIDKSRPLLVLDHKTGSYGNFTRPEQLPQLLTLGRAACLLFNRSSFIPAILHAPREGFPVVYASEPQTLDDTVGFAIDLKKQLERVGDNSLRLGPECKYCPCKQQCPAQSRDLIDSAASLVEKANLIGSELVLVGNDSLTTRDERMGRLHLLMQRFEELKKAANAEIKRSILADPALEPIRPDGKRLVIQHKSVESLSKASIIRALGKVEGEKEIARLRELGAIEVSERDELWAR